MREAISGTMSSFYMARDRQTERIVGLKLLDIQKTAAFNARFTGLTRPSEGEIAVLFDHPNIVRTYEHGITTDNQQFLVMEFLDGPGMNSLVVVKSPQLEGLRLSLIRQAAEALSKVHEAGFIHRDVCPRNLVLSRDLKTLKLIDFGLTVPATPPFMSGTNRTGTANYMAPELVRRKRADQRVDIFAFGVTAYELFAFDLPWPRGSSGQAAMSHGVEAPTELREVCPDIHPQIAFAIHCCLEADPEKRPKTMQQFLDKIRHVESDRK